MNLFGKTTESGESFNNSFGARRPARSGGIDSRRAVAQHHPRRMRRGFQRWKWWADGHQTARLRALSLLVVLAFAVVTAWQLPQGHLQEWDEYLTAQRSREIGLTGALVPIHYNFYPVLNKPPLQYYATALSQVLVPDLELAVRLWPWLAALGLLLVVADVLPRLRVSEPGVLLGLVALGTYPLFRHHAVAGLLDMGAAAFCFGTLYTLDRAWGRRGGWIIVGVVAGLGALQKTPLPILVLLVAGLVHLLCSPREDWRAHTRWWVSALLLSLLPLGLWNALLLRELSAEAVEASLGHQWLLHVVGHQPEKNLTVDYAAVLLGNGWLLTFLGLPAWGLLMVQGWGSRQPLRLNLALIPLLYGIFVLQMNSADPRYLLPLLPFAAVALGAAVGELPPRWSALGLLLALGIGAEGLSRQPEGNALTDLRGNVPAAVRFRELWEPSLTPTFVYAQEDWMDFHVGVFLYYGDMPVPFAWPSLEWLEQGNPLPAPALGVTQAQHFARLQALFPTLTALDEKEGIVIWRYGEPPDSP